MRKNSVRKISDNPFFNMPLCPSQKHQTPPSQARITQSKASTPLAGWALGQYEHTCPDCGNIIRFAVFEVSGEKAYQEFGSSIFGGASYQGGATKKEIEKSKLDALSFLRKRKVSL